MITRRALYLLLVAAPILALATITPIALWAAVAYTVGVLALLALDFIVSPRPGNFRLARENDAKLSLGADNIVHIIVRRLGSPDAAGVRARPIRFVVRDEPPAEYVVSPLFLPGTIAPSEQLDLTYIVKPLRRGDYAFGGCNLRYAGVLGLIMRQHRYPLNI
jgi:uncharacterized protein (DUF58 family)